MVARPHDDVQAPVGLDEVGNPVQSGLSGAGPHPRRVGLIAEPVAPTMVLRPEPDPRPAIAAPVVAYRFIVAVGEGRPRPRLPGLPDALRFLPPVPRP